MKSLRALLTCTAIFSLHCAGSSSDGGFAKESPANASEGASSGGNMFGTDTDAGVPTDFECKGVDLVFVIDNSKSMEEEQANLGKNFREAIKTLNDAKSKKGVPIDYRVAVTTSGRDVNYTIEAPGFPAIPQIEKGDNGVFRQKSECGSMRRWFSKGDPSIEANFACLAKVGIGGPALEMPLEALRLAFSDRMTDGTNAGFLRPDALLATVIITDEDDCSRSDNNFKWKGEAFEPCHQFPGVRPVSDYVAAMDNAAQGNGRWATSVIAGLGPNSCQSSFGKAVEAHRLKSFAAAAGANGSTSSICDGDLLSALRTTLSKFDDACKRLPPPVVR